MKATDSDPRLHETTLTAMSDGDLQLTQLQEQLVSTMIENETIKAELVQYKEKNRVDEILRELELEREKTAQLSIQLQQQIYRTKEMSRREVDMAEEAVEELSDDVTTEPSVIAPQDWWSWVQVYVVNMYHELVADLTQEPDVDDHGDPDGDQLAVKQLKDNIKRFKKGVGPIFRFFKGVHGIFTYKSPSFSLISFAIYMYSVWYGWFVPVLLFLCIVRLLVNWLKSRGWKINVHFVTYPDLDEDKESVDAELALSDKFNLVLQVARQVQNVLGQLADGLEKIKNLLTWRSPEESKQVLTVLMIVFLMSCIMSGVAFFRLAALYLGIKMFIIEYFYDRFPLFKRRHDAIYKIWQQLPTDAVLEDQYKRSLVDQHIIISRADGSEEIVVDSQSPCVEISDDDRTFCDVFCLPLSERPLPEWEDGWRVSIVDKEKPFLKALSRTGRMYLTKSFLCVERFKFESPKNILIPLTNVTSIEKAKPFSWIPGAGMSIQIAVVGYEQPYTFGAIINRDECFKLLVAHGLRLQLPWALRHASALSGNSRSQSPAPDAGATDSSPPSSAKDERTFRMSDLRDDVDDDDRLLQYAT